MIVRFATLLALVACHTESRPPPQPPLHHEVADKHVSLAQRAEQALTADTPLDYDRPMLAKPDPRTETLALFKQACDAGDAQSCRRGLGVTDRAGEAMFVDAVANHCRRGDLLSCRALPRDRDGQPAIDAPGSVGRSLACHDAPERAGCDMAAVRRECEAGFPDSCRLLLGAPDTDQLMKRVTTLSREGCAAGLDRECEEALSPYEMDGWKPEEQLAIARQLCSETRACGRYAQTLMDAGDPAHARDAFELACQYKSAIFGTCMSLGMDYLDGKLPEPVPGRGQKLLDFDCHVVLEAMKSRERVLKSRPECKRAKLD